MTGAELRAIRERERLSRPALAYLAGLHPDSVKYWESKATIDLRGHAPQKMLKALGAEYHLVNREFNAGDFCALTRARWGVRQSGNFVRPEGVRCCNPEGHHMPRKGD